MDKDGATDHWTKKLIEDGSYESLNYTLIYHMGLTLGLSIRDIDDMTVGEILDISYYRIKQNEKQKNQSEEKTVKATQADYDAF